MTYAYSQLDLLKVGGAVFAGLVIVYFGLVIFDLVYKRLGYDRE